MDKNLKIDIDFSSELLEVLEEFFELCIFTQHCHWNVEGPLFGPVHAVLNDLYDFYFESQDLVAERVRQIGNPVKSKFKVDVEVSNNPEVFLPQLLDKMYSNIVFVRELISEINKTNDHSSGNILIDITQDHEKLLWKIRSLVVPIGDED